MQRVGRINMPSYRIIVVEHTESPKTGNIVEKVGTYNPRSKERVIDTERVQYWMSVGAKPSDTVHNMLVTLGVIKGKKINVLPKFVEPTKEPAAVESSGEAKEATAAPVEEETPASAQGGPASGGEEAAPAVAEDTPAAEEETPSEEAK